MVSRKYRLIGVLSLILIVSFVSISVINYRTTKAAVHEEIITSSLPLLRENIYSDIQKDVVPAVNHASVMANDAFLINWVLRGEQDIEAIAGYLQKLQEKYDYFTTFFISARSRNYYHYTGVLKKISREDPHDIWYFRFAGSDKEYDLDVDTNEAANNILTIFINFRVENEAGDLLGVTGVGIKMENFSNFLARKQEKYERSIFLVDETERIQAHPDAGMIGTPVRELTGLEDIADSLLASSEEPVDGSYSYEGDTFLVTARYIPELDWHLFVEQNQSAALRNARNSFRRTILIGLATSAIIILLSFLTIGHYQQNLERLAVTDELTGAANRREFHRQIEQGLYRNRRYRLPLSLILLDVDHFKQINDRHGHLHGDRVLRRISQLIRNRIRPDDFLARWGGDEFVLLLECRMEEALRTADRLKDILGMEGIGVSMGIATLSLDASEEVTAEELVARADQALYTSKRKGRGRITAAGAEASRWHGAEASEPDEPDEPDEPSPDGRP